MDGYFARWSEPKAGIYQEKVDDARYYLTNIRDAMVYNYLPIYFSGDYAGIAGIGNIEFRQ
jgi:hypothetical protein